MESLLIITTGKRQYFLLKLRREETKSAQRKKEWVHKVFKSSQASWLKKYPIFSQGGRNKLCDESLDGSVGQDEDILKKKSFSIVKEENKNKRGGNVECLGYRARHYFVLGKGKGTRKIFSFCLKRY